MVLNLDEYSDKCKPLFKGYSKKWEFDINGENYIFKTNYKEVRRDIIEALVAYILKRTGCKNFVDYELATYEGQNGCISKSFIDDKYKYELTIMKIMYINYYNEVNHTKANYALEIDDEFFNQFCEFIDEDERAGQYDFSLDYIMGEVKKYCDNYNVKYDEQELCDKLTEMAIYDYFLCNPDRHWDNILFLFNETENGLKIDLSKIYDNGEAFNYYSSAKCREEIKDSVITRIGLSENGRVNTFEDNNYFKNGGILASDIFEFIKANPKYRKLVNTLKDLDINDIMLDFEKDKEYKIPLKMKDEISEAVENRQETYAKSVAKLQKRLSKSKEINI